MSNAETQLSRQEQARETAAELLAEMETGSSTSEAIVLKAMRVARLLRDQDMQAWLGLELRGYPQGFDYKRLGAAVRYVGVSGRARVGLYVAQGLPELEAEIATRRIVLGKIAPSATLPDNVVSLAQDRALQLQNQIAQHQGIVSGVKGAIHSYLADTFISLTYGGRVQTLFDGARDLTDRFIAANCPKAVEQLLSAEERLAHGDGESCSQALLSCRRVLLTVADAVFPAQPAPYKDAKGAERPVGPDDYKNRLLAFLTERLKARPQAAMVIAELEHLAGRLDAVYAEVCKGVHSGVSPEEARLALIHTYLFIAEIAKAASDSASPAQPNKQGN